MPITSKYGWRKNPLKGGRDKQFHAGIDIDCEVGDKVYAWRSGKVIQVGYNKSAGNFVSIQHDDNYISKYHHLKKYKVKKNDLVSGGQHIGYGGKSGRVTGSHLHFSLLKKNKHIDPLKYIKQARQVDLSAPVQQKIVTIEKYLMIRSYPIDGKVFVDGVYRGTTPLELKLTYGEHFVEVDTDGSFERYVGRLWINQNFSHLFVVDLTQIQK